MAETFSPVSLVARRYAESLFALASDSGYVEAVEEKLADIQLLLDESSDFRQFITSPVFSARDQLRVINVLVRKAGFIADGASGLVGNFLKVTASAGRLSVLPGIIKSFQEQVTAMRGEISVKVVSAHVLDPVLKKELTAVLVPSVDKNATLCVQVDPAILGGLVVRIGSCQIDASLRTRLSSLKLALKEVG